MQAEQQNYGMAEIVLIGFLLVPGMAVTSVVPFAHAAYATYRVAREDHRYVGDPIENR